MPDLTRKSLQLGVIFFDSMDLQPYDGALMLNDSLPSQIDIRKLVVKGTQIQAVVPVSSLPRFVDMLSDSSGVVEVDLQFYLDDQRIRKVEGQLKSQVNVTCQRCLEPMSINIDTQFEQGIVWSEDDSKRLPADMDPLIVGEELIDLSDVVTEELILSFPYVSYHVESECHQSAGYESVDPDRQDDHAATEVGEERENPFKVLEQLKRDSSS